MFSFRCPSHGTEVLVWPSDIDEVVNAPDGIGIVFHCSCGYRGMLIEHRDGGEIVVSLGGEAHADGGGDEVVLTA